MPSVLRMRVSPRTARSVALAAMPSSRRCRANSLLHSRSVALRMFSRTPLFANGLHDHVHVGVRLIGVQHHRVAMLEPEFLPRKVLHRRQHLVRRCPRRHREHELVNQLRRRSTRPRLKVGLTPMLFQIQIPVFQQLLLDPFARQASDRRRSRSPPLPLDSGRPRWRPDGLEVLPSPAEHFDHDFRSPADGAT